MLKIGNTYCIRFNGADTLTEITIKTEYIKLSQLLKLIDAIDSGSEAKAFITAGQVAVNGITATERGKKIRAGDVVAVKGMAPVTVKAG